MSENHRPHPLGGPTYIDENGYVQLPKMVPGLERSVPEALKGHVIAYRTPYVSNACDAYRELFGRMRNGTAISSVDYPGTQIKADGLAMRAAKDKYGNVTHEIHAFGMLVTRREYPQKPTSGLIEEE